MARIQAIEAFPDNKSNSVKPINLRDDDKIRKSCTACKFRGHSVTDCWGKCQHCGKYGHKSNLCRHKPDSQNENLPKRLLLMVNPNPKGRKRKEEKRKPKKLLNWLKRCHYTHLLIVVTMKHHLLMATILPKVKL